MKKEVLSTKYNLLLERLGKMSLGDLQSDGFKNFWEDLVLVFEWLTEDQRKSLIMKIKEKFDLQAEEL